jgi:DNA-binding transcriptional LysR family regulator
VALTRRREASNTLALTGLVAAELGVTLFPESLIGFLGRSVETRPIMHKAFRSRTFPVWQRNNRARAMQHFIDIAKHRGLAR